MIPRSAGLAALIDWLIESQPVRGWLARWPASLRAPRPLMPPAARKPARPPGRRRRASSTRPAPQVNQATPAQATFPPPLPRLACTGQRQQQFNFLSAGHPTVPSGLHLCGGRLARPRRPERGPSVPGGQVAAEQRGARAAAAHSKLKLAMTKPCRPRAHSLAGSRSIKGRARVGRPPLWGADKVGQSRRPSSCNSLDGGPSLAATRKINWRPQQASGR